ncbi:MAG: GIY-YIG nuclease family protein [Xanthomonadaceae bacterium]|nr:GIY-YIG nuclease family protein [Xanthomonadaceae bacterium]
MNRAEAVELLSSAKGRFYVYVLLRPDGTPFYVGKGKGLRLFFHESEALGDGCSHKLNTIRANTRAGKEIAYEIAAFYDDEDQCHRREIEEIARIGRHDLKTGPLTNLTAGGEGTSGLADETKQRIDAELHGPDAPGERGAANRFFLKLCKETRSVPVRPASAFSPKALKPHRCTRAPSRRMAAALAASAIANRVLLEPGCVIPRKLSIDGSVMYIENGASADILKAGLATLVPGRPAGDEHFLLDHQAVQKLLSLSDHDLLLDAGVLMPADLGVAALPNDSLQSDAPHAARA